MSHGHQATLIEIFARHRVAPNLLMLLMILSGLWGLSKLNIQFLPHFDLNFVTIRVPWTGATAEDTEQSIIIPLEQELKDIDYVKEMTSTSGQGFGIVVMEFETDAEMGIALDRVKEKVAQVRNLPSGSEEPVVTKIERYEDIASVMLVGASHDSLQHLARNYERELLSRGVSKIDVEGIPDEEIAIQITSESLQRLGMTLNELAARIRQLSQDIPAGTIGRADTARQVRTLEQRRDIYAFESLPLITDNNGTLITLGDVATLVRKPQEREYQTFYHGKPAIILQLKRTQNADTLDAANILEQWVEDTRPNLPPSVEMHVFNEKWTLIKDRIMLLVKNGGGGLLLVVAILFLFLNGRVAFWVTVGIPVSFAAALGILYLAGGTINMVSLFAFIMALGIIVDDAIVVGEDALTHYQSGEPPIVSALGGAKRMLAPVMSSSLTTISAFLPLMAISGIFGAILFAIPLVVICVIVASIVECFFILPGHLRHSFEKMAKAKKGSFRDRFDNGFERFKEQRFRPIANYAIHHRTATASLAIAIFLVIMGVLQSGRLGFSFFPSPEGDIVSVNVAFASGTPPEQVHRFLRHMEDKLVETDKQLSEQPLVTNHVVYEGIASFTENERDLGDQYGRMTVALTQPDSRDINNTEFIQAWRAKITPAPGLEKLVIRSQRGGPPGSDIDIKLIGQNAQELKTAAAELLEHYQRYSGVLNPEDDLPYGQEQLIVRLTPMGLALGFSIENIASQIRTAFDGQLIQIYYENIEEVEVRLSLTDEERYDVNTIDSLRIKAPNGNMVSLASVADIDSQRGLQVLRHTDGELAVHVKAEVDDQAGNANQIVDELKQDVLPDLTAKYGIRYGFSGRQKDQAATLKDMFVGAVIGVVLIYIILAWVFASWAWPLAVMMAIPFGLTGAIIGHLVMGLDLTLLSMFGFFGLSGIVINDSIILVTRYKELRKQGLTRDEAIVEASCQRLRAVILTSLTTIAGLLPLLFETSLQAQFLIPMAATISFGLAYGTLLVLLVIPALLSLIESMVEATKDWFNKPKTITMPETIQD